MFWSGLESERRTPKSRLRKVFRFTSLSVQTFGLIIMEYKRLYCLLVLTTTPFSLSVLLHRLLSLEPARLESVIATLRPAQRITTRPARLWRFFLYKPPSKTSLGMSFIVFENFLTTYHAHRTSPNHFSSICHILVPTPHLGKFCYCLLLDGRI